MSVRKIADCDGRSPSGKVRHVRVVYNTELEEFVCRVTDDGKRREGIDYYTPSKSDAVKTAVYLCGLGSAVRWFGQQTTAGNGEEGYDL